MSQCDHLLVAGVFDSLAEPRRRDVLDRLLIAEGEAVPFEALVDHVVEAEGSSRSPERETVASSLHHRHLPRLAEEGLVDYDGDRGPVTAAGRIEIAEPYLSYARRLEDGGGTGA